MAITVRVPTTLRTFTGGESKVKVNGSKIGEVLKNFLAQTGIPRHRVFTDEGVIVRHINISVDGEQINRLDAVDTEVMDGAELSIVVAVAGG